MIKVMKDKNRGGDTFPRFARTKEQGSTEPFNWSIINLSIFILTYQMQGRFKMEYRLFTIVRYNYKDYNKQSNIQYKAAVQ